MRQFRFSLTISDDLTLRAAHLVYFEKLIAQSARDLRPTSVQHNVNCIGVVLTIQESGEWRRKLELHSFKLLALPINFLDEDDDSSFGV